LKNDDYGLGTFPRIIVSQRSNFEQLRFLSNFEQLRFLSNFERHVFKQLRFLSNFEQV
jgi:hypothetical protein